jgi:hypothetical protein
VIRKQRLTDAETDAIVRNLLALGDVPDPEAVRKGFKGYVHDVQEILTAKFGFCLLAELKALRAKLDAVREGPDTVAEHRLIGEINGYPQSTVERASL